MFSRFFKFEVSDMLAIISAYNRFMVNSFGHYIHHSFKNLKKITPYAENQPFCQKNPKLTWSDYVPYLGHQKTSYNSRMIQTQFLRILNLRSLIFLWFFKVFNFILQKYLHCGPSCLESVAQVESIGIYNGLFRKHVLCPVFSVSFW